MDQKLHEQLQKLVKYLRKATALADAIEAEFGIQVSDQRLKSALQPEPTPALETSTNQKGVSTQVLRSRINKLINVLLGQGMTIGQISSTVGGKEWLTMIRDTDRPLYAATTHKRLEATYRALTPLVRVAVSPQVATSSSRMSSNSSAYVGVCEKRQEELNRMFARSRTKLSKGPRRERH